MSVNDEDSVEGMEATDFSLQSSVLKRDAQRSAFTPYKSTTVLTNLQRGNVQATTVTCIPERNIHQLAAQGELFADEIRDLVCIDKVDDRGFTPLIWAATYGQLTTVKSLTDHNANVNYRSPSGETALHFACSNGHVHVVKELIAKNAELDHCDEEGNTPMIYAAFRNHASCVSELLEAGADYTLDNNGDETAYSISMSKGFKSVQQIIEGFMLKNVFQVSNTSTP